MENNKKNISNTMEINAILEEAKKNRTQDVYLSGGAKPQRPSQNAPTKAKAKQPQQSQQEEQVDIQSGFVVYDKAEQGKKKKKGKKTGLVIAIVSLVLVLALGAGFCAYTFLGEFKYDKNVYVNDICIGGMTEAEALSALEQEEAKLTGNVNITVNAGDNSTTITNDDMACALNTDEVLAEAKQYSEDTLIPKGEQRFYISLNVTDEAIDTITEKVASNLDQEAVDAVVTKFDSSKSGADRFTFEDEITGISVNKESFKEQLKQLIADGTMNTTIEADADVVEPKYTKEYLIKNIKQVSTYTTTSTNGANGNNNMKVSAKACNNSIINPGEVWSFNECTGDSNLESNGYKVAGVLINGQSAQGVGGGICQTSTTIYNAGLLCGIHVQERQPHAYPSSYCPIGLDATIDYGNIDLKLKNTFDYQLFIECYMEGVKVVCKFYGLENPYFDEVKVTSTQTSSNSAVASRAFYKDGKRVTGDNLPDEELPSSRYSTSGSSSSSSSSSTTTQSTQTPSTGSSTATTPDTDTDTPDDGGDSGDGGDGSDSGNVSDSSGGDSGDVDTGDYVEMETPAQ